MVLAVRKHQRTTLLLLSAQHFHVWWIEIRLSLLYVGSLLISELLCSSKNIFSAAPKFFPWSVLLLSNKLPCPVVSMKDYYSSLACLILYKLCLLLGYGILGGIAITAWLVSIFDILDNEKQNHHPLCSEVISS